MSTPAALRGLANLHENAAREPYKNPDVLTTIRLTVAALRELAEIKEAAGELEEAIRQLGGPVTDEMPESIAEQLVDETYHALTLARAVVARALAAEAERDALKKRVAELEARGNVVIKEEAFPPVEWELMRPLESCANGDGNPVCPPSLVICRACMDKITETLHEMLRKAEEIERPRSDCFYIGSAETPEEILQQHMREGSGE